MFILVKALSFFLVFKSDGKKKREKQIKLL